MLTRLNAPHLVARDTGALGQILLTPPACLTKLSYLLSNTVPVHPFKVTMILHKCRNNLHRLLNNCYKYVE